MEIQTNPAENALQLTPEERQAAADKEIAQGKLDDKDPEAEPAAEGAEPEEPETETAPEEPEKVEPIGEVGDWVLFNPGNNDMRPAMVTHVDDKTGLASLMVVYKSHIDFVGERRIEETQEH